MSASTGIEWTDSTWNPLRGCTRVSERCRFCYAERIAARFSAPGQPYHGFAQRTPKGSAWTGKVELVETALDLPRRWRKPRRIFVNSMSDLFHEDVPDEWIDRIFAVMALAPRHTFIVLTKRSARMREYLAVLDLRARVDAIVDFLASEMSDPLARRTDDLRATAPDLFEDDAWPLPNVWLGVSAEHQAAADERIPDLLATPAAARLVSCEPLLGPIDLNRAYSPHGITPLQWVIAGGESGPGARPLHPDWARGLRDQCQAAGVPFFFKQWGEWAPRDDVSSEQQESDELARVDDRRWRSLDNQLLERVGKKAAGRRLDGREWSEFRTRRCECFGSIVLPPAPLSAPPNTPPLKWRGE